MIIVDGSASCGKTLYLKKKAEYLRKQGKKVFVVGEKEGGERYHQFYDDDKALEDEEVVSLLFENEQLKQKISELKFLLELAKLHTEVAEGKMDKFVELKLND